MVGGPQPTLKEQEEAIRERVEKAQVKARKAATLLENPLIQEALQIHGETLVELWKSTPPDATEERERLYFQYHAGKVFETYLRRCVNSGKVEALTAAMVLPNDGGESQQRPG